MLAEAETLTKACPECAEDVKAVARVCRYCGHRWAPPPNACVSDEQGLAGSVGEAGPAEPGAIVALEPSPLAAEAPSPTPSTIVGSGTDLRCACGCGRRVGLAQEDANDWAATVRAELDEWARHDLVGWSHVDEFVDAGLDISEQLKRSVHGEPVDRAYDRQHVAYWVTTSRVALAKAAAVDDHRPADEPPRSTNTSPIEVALGVARSLGRFAVWLFGLALLLGLIGGVLFAYLGLFKGGYVMAAGLIAIVGGVLSAVMILSLDEYRSRHRRRRI